MPCSRRAACYTSRRTVAEESDESLAIFVGHDHPLARPTIVTTADIRATPAIHLTPRNPLRPLVNRILEQVGVAGSPIGLETDEYGLILTCLRQNRGFTCMFQTAETEVAQTSGLKRLVLEHALPALQVRRLVHSSARHDRAGSLLVRILDEALTSFNTAKRLEPLIEGAL